MSEKVHPTIPKGIVGSFEGTVLQRNLKDLAWEATDISLRVLKESNKSRFNRYSVRNSVLIIIYPILPFGIVACTFFVTTFLKIAVYTVCSLGRKF